jgi:hypothetical protein
LSTLPPPVLISGKLPRSLSMSRKDVPYAILIVAFQIVMFFAGRFSAGSPINNALPVATASAHEMPAKAAEPTLDAATIAFVKQWRAEHQDDATVPVVSLGSLPDAPPAAPSAVASASVHHPVAEKSKSAPVTTQAPAPMKIELEEDPAAVANPYSKTTAKPASSSPGF